MKKIVRRCDVCGSDYRVQEWNKSGRLLCSKHTHQMDRYGFIKEITKKDKNDIVIYDDYAEIILRDIYGEVNGVTKIDLEDIDLVCQYKWHKHSHKGCDYAICMQSIKLEDGSYKHKSIRLHRLIMGVLDDKSVIVDHINTFEKMDNRKSNLRLFKSQSENNANKKIQTNNKSGIIGVRQTKSGSWQAYLVYEKEHKLNKVFSTKEEAVYARELAELYYFREKGLQYKKLVEKYKDIIDDVLQSGIDKYIYGGV